MKKRIVVILFFSALSLSLIFGMGLIRTVRASTHHVYLGQSIQNAINSAQTGDTIFVHSGTYVEHITLNKSISLIGESNYNTIIDGKSTGTVMNIEANNVNITGFTIHNASALDFSGIGIHVLGSGGNNISNNIIANNYCGIVVQCDSNILANNNVSNNKWGIEIDHCDNNTLTSNTISSNLLGGIFFGNLSSNHKLVGNNISDNPIGVYIGGFSYNGGEIFHNNFINNSNQVFRSWPEIYTDAWDDGYPSGGNYWSDFEERYPYVEDIHSGPNQDQPGSDGIWDEPYVIDVNNQDNYPLTEPWTSCMQQETVVFYKHSTVSRSTSSYNDSDPASRTGIVSGEANVTFSPPDSNGVINVTVPHPDSGQTRYDPIANQTNYIFAIQEGYGKLYTNDSVGDVDIISMTNDTGTFFKNWSDGTWHPEGEEWIGDGILDPAGSAWYVQIFNSSYYLGNGTDGLRIGSFLTQIWFTTGFSENTIIEPASRLNGFHLNATGAPFSPPLPGGIVTFVYIHAKLNIPWWQGKHLDFQAYADEMQVEPPAFMASLFSPANLYVTDPNGDHIGTNPVTGVYVNDIDGAFYSGPGSHPQRIVIPDPVDGVYDIKIVGTDTGEYTSVIEYATEEKITTDMYSGNTTSGQIWKSEANVSEGEMTSTEPVLTSPVGGISIPVDKLELLAPYIGLIMLLAVAVVTVIYVKKRKRHTEILS